MVVPILEVVLSNKEDHNFKDFNAHDGKEWFEGLVAAAKQISGLVRAGWAQSNKDPEMVMHFIGNFMVPSADSANI
jgi:hypothetical protein